jgi:hypothetical protein
MEDWYNKYNTELPQEAIPTFFQWVEKMKEQTGRNILLDKNSYDIQGYFLSGDWKNFGGGHMPDTYKKPNHTSFSDESIYHGVDGFEGGKWEKINDKWQFNPSMTNIDIHGAKGLIDYFNEYEPDSDLKF